MASLQGTSKFVVKPSSGPRKSFSSDFLDENEFISICPNPEKERREDEQRATAKATEFEFLSGNLTNMLSADELFSEGKLLPFWQVHQAEKLNRIVLKPEIHAGDDVGDDGPHVRKQLMTDKEENRISWFIDDDPSPRPPKCTVLLWKELLRLKKQSGFSMTSSPALSSSALSSSSSSSALADDERKGRVAVRENNEEKTNNNVKRINKKGGERTRTGSIRIRIRPVINVPICSQAKNIALSPIFALRKGRLEK